MTSKTKRSLEPMDSGGSTRKLAKDDPEASSSEKVMMGITPVAASDGLSNDAVVGVLVGAGDTGSNGSTPKKRSAGQKRGRSWNRDEEILLMDAWNEVAGHGLKSKQVADEMEKVFHAMATKKWGEIHQNTIHALDRKGGSLIARAKGLIRQFSEIVTFARSHTAAINFPNGHTEAELEQLKIEINTKRSANGLEQFRHWHVRDALIQQHLFVSKMASVNAGSNNGSTKAAKIQKRKSFPQTQDGITRQQENDVERERLELERQRFRENQRATTLDSLHKLLGTLGEGDETAPLIRQQILKLTIATE